eukprot:356460-Chlamydomonas_euryale.AAC.4
MSPVARLSAPTAPHSARRCRNRGARPAHGCSLRCRRRRLQCAPDPRESCYRIPWWCRAAARCALLRERAGREPLGGRPEVTRWGQRWRLPECRLRATAAAAARLQRACMHAAAYGMFNVRPPNAACAIRARVMRAVRDVHVPGRHAGAPTEVAGARWQTRRDEAASATAHAHGLAAARHCGTPGLASLSKYANAHCVCNAARRLAARRAALIWRRGAGRGGGG